MKKLNLNKKTKLAKRTVLYIANAVAFAVIVALMIIQLCSVAGLHEYIEPAFAASFVTSIVTDSLVLQCAFTIFSLIIYYLSIVADSFSHKKKESGEAAGEQSAKNSNN